MRIWIIVVLLAATGAVAWFLRGPSPKPSPLPPNGGVSQPSGAVGPTAEEREGIDRGLEWLASAQEPDGRWYCARWSSYKRTLNIPGIGAGTVDLLDPALTGLALLPFLYDGHTPTQGKHAGVVERAVAWLRMIAESYASGGLPRHTGNQPGLWHWGIIADDYNPVVVYAVLAEVLRRTGDETLRPIVEEGVRQMVFERREDRPWASTLNPYDIGAVVFWVELLETAEACGVKVPQRARLEARAYLREMTDEATGRILTKDVCTECLGGWDAQSVAILTRAWIDPRPDRIREMELDTIAAHAPVWETRWKLPEDPSKGPSECYRITRDIVNYFFWYHGSVAIERHGGARRDPWRKALLAALLPHQRKEGEHAGSWDPVDPWGALAGRVYSTAYSVMCLQVPYARPR